MPSVSAFGERDFFALFGLATAFSLDEKELTKRYLALQEQVHPDRYAAKSSIERRLAISAASRLNDAYTTLKDPLARAAYLLSLQGMNVFSETDTAVPEAFLEQQIQWTEALMEADDNSERQQLIDDIMQTRTQTITIAAKSLAAEEWQTAYDAVRQWRYLDKLLQNQGTTNAIAD